MRKTKKTPTKPISPRAVFQVPLPEPLHSLELREHPGTRRDQGSHSPSLCQLQAAFSLPARHKGAVRAASPGGSEKGPLESALSNFSFKMPQKGHANDVYHQVINVSASPLGSRSWRWERCPCLFSSSSGRTKPSEAQHGPFPNGDICKYSFPNDRFLKPATGNGISCLF